MMGKPSGSMSISFKKSFLRLKFFPIRLPDFCSWHQAVKASVGSRVCKLIQSVEKCDSKLLIELPLEASDAKESDPKMPEGKVPVKTEPKYTCIPQKSGQIERKVLKMTNAVQINRL